MKKSSRYISLLLSLTCASAFAQDINKEITIEKEIVPEQRAATRLAVPHTVISPILQRPDLQFNLADRGVGIVPRFNPLMPASTLPAVELSPYRGYAAIGYFPAYNLGVTAGYDFINNEKTILGASVQFIGYNYNIERKDYQDETIKEKLKRSDATANIGLTHYFNPGQSLDVNLDFGYGKVDVPYPNNFCDHKSLRLGLDARWRSGSMTEFYTVGLRGGLINFDGDFWVGGHIPYMKETDFGADFGLNYGSLSIGIDGSFRRHGDFDTPGVGHVANSKLISLVSAVPAYTFDNGDGTKVRFGAKVQYTGGSRGKFHVAPDVMIAIAPSSTFAFQADIRGGEVMNSLADLYQITPFFSPHDAYLTSNIPVAADIRFVVGPFSGASVEIFGGYAITKNWLMPDYDCTYTSCNLKGWHAGLKVAYSRGSWLDASVSAELAPQKYNQGYYLWRDRAKSVINANVAVNPIKKLRLSAGYELRSGRGMYNSIYDNPLLIKMSSVNNLTFGAAYQITPAFTVFGRGENLLNHDNTLLFGIPSQGITGLIGVEAKF